MAECGRLRSRGHRGWRDWGSPDSHSERTGVAVAGCAHRPGTHRGFIYPRRLILPRYTPLSSVIRGRSLTVAASTHWVVSPSTPGPESKPMSLLFSPTQFGPL